MKKQIKNNIENDHPQKFKNNFPRQSYIITLLLLQKNGGCHKSLTDRIKIVLATHLLSLCPREYVTESVKFYSSCDCAVQLHRKRTKLQAK